MSKDKGGKKEVKKAPADKKGGKSKPISSYKNEGNPGQKSASIEAFSPKTDAKSGGKH